MAKVTSVLHGDPPNFGGIYCWLVVNCMDIMVNYGYIYILGGGIPTPLKNMKVKWDDYSQCIEKWNSCSKPPNRLVREQRIYKSSVSWGFEGTMQSSSTTSRVPFPCATWSLSAHDRTALPCLAPSCKSSGPYGFPMCSQISFHISAVGMARVQLLN